MVDTSANNKRITKNTIFLYIRMFFVLIINLYTSRVLLNALGVEDYGIYNVVAGFVALFGFLNATLSSSVQRFYNYEGTKNGCEGFQNVYITSLLTHIIIAVAAFGLLETFGLWYINKVMVMPSDRLFAASILFQMSSLSMILMTIQIPFVGAIMAKERMDFYAIVSIFDVIFRFIIALIISLTDYDSLFIYGILLFGVSLVNFSLYVGYCKTKFQEMKLRRYFDKQVFRSMMSFSGWNLVGTLVFMLKGQGINMLLNIFFGPVINAARGVAYQVNGAISSFTSNIFVAFGTQVVKSYADGNITRIKQMMFTESKICFSLIAIIIVPVVLEIDYLLYLWLGDAVPEHTNIFAILVLIDSLICTLNTPCTQIVQATGKIKFYQIGSSIVNLMLLPLAWIFLMLGFSAECAFIVTIFVSCVNQVVCLYFANKQIAFGILCYLKEIVVKCSAFILFLPILPVIVHMAFSVGFFKLIMVGLASVISGLALTYGIMFGQDERIAVRNLVKAKIG